MRNHAPTERIAARSCYEANIFDQRSDPSYGTGATIKFRKVAIEPL